MKILKWLALGAFWILVFQGFFYLKDAAVDGASSSSNAGWAGLTFLVGYVLIIALIVWGYSRISKRLSATR